MKPDVVSSSHQVPVATMFEPPQVAQEGLGIQHASVAQIFSLQHCTRAVPSTFNLQLSLAIPLVLQSNARSACDEARI